MSRPLARIAAIDLARAIAIVGMLSVHVRAGVTGGWLTPVLLVPRGRSAILFGLLAGVGVSLMVRGRATSTSHARLVLLWRAAVLLPLGLWLQTLDHRVLVILGDYSLLFLVAIVVMRWSDLWLLVAAAVSATVGSVVYRYGQLTAPATFDRSPASLDAPLLDNLHALVLSGPYPLITWIAPLCIGVWLGRRDLRAPGLARRLLLIGGVPALVIPVVSLAHRRMVGPLLEGWWPLLSDLPHSQMPLWLVSATASAVTVLGACLWLERVAPGPVAWGAAAGQLAFTWYVVHLVILHVDGGLLRTGTVAGTAIVVTVFAVVMAVVSRLWLQVFSRGPLEYVLRLPRRRPAPASPAPIAPSGSSPPSGRSDLGSAE